MASKTCMNVLCGASTSVQWGKGWALRSAEFALLCDKCGSAYEQSVFCDVFHSKESGWRECALCGKRLHCGCIASSSLLELLDCGGVSCINCTKNSGIAPIASNEKPNGSDNVNGLLSTSVDNQLDGSSVDKMKLMQLSNNTERNGLRHLLQSQNADTNGTFGKLKQEEVLPSVGEIGSTFSNFSHACNGSSNTTKPDVYNTNMGTKDIYESLPQTNLSMTLGTPGHSNSLPTAVADERENCKISSPFLQGPRSRHLLPKPPRSALAGGLEANAGVVSQIRVARPPAEGRGRNQLLPRYWPRITDQELQQISGDSNSTIVPLFEKMLSASDAGRIGRLVLPKACAEAYFPPISQPEGLPLRIQDVKGKEWVFQFRFWPNNNSRMYVLEGVTPCIQSMQLQAGDTVTFSRMDPEGKLIMGFRKASSSVAIQSVKGSADPHLNALSKHLSSAAGDVSWHKSEKNEDRTREGFLLPSVLAPERKRARNIGSKSKRLLIDSQDALELKLTWEEAQDLLYPPPTLKPSTVMIEDHEFEEYDEPPVFGKRSIFVARSTGGQEQWAQCDSCSKWRRLPVDILLPSKWTCADNVWDQSRCSCSALDELNPRELEHLLRLNKEFKKRRIVTNQGHESSGLDALANAAILGDSVGEPGTPSVAATTKHPRHRPGCTCIVCIQPPSGKGKHKPTCTCNVCMTVKRRFKTLMMRKKKRQSEREAEIAQRNQHTLGSRDEAEVDSNSRHASSHIDPSENETRSGNELESKSPSKLAETGKGQLDLNCHPQREEELQMGSKRVSMMGLLEIASLPLETYLKQNGLTSLITEQQASSAPHVPPQSTNENAGQFNDDGCLSAVQEREGGGEEYCGPDQSQTDAQS
ncbi:B3 domain-containing transcription repressor VAL2-like isoform X4 [Alnus glutinosa]|uniref:B3 domain-containing transcription repressor VAL2-like isoform X4 n=1 Tax=Alnus glutinosa TaxID=3517 RepID=UPI002D76E89B|nr:B3 domain-containing transcription repressor VAL2-like isoform X4 [Alnus glutinosa]